MKLQFIIALLMFAITPISAFAQTGDIQGTVYQQSTGKPFEGVNVHITETNQNQKTDENGIFRFTELREGTYTFVVTHPSGTAPIEISAQISSGGTTEVKVYLGAEVKLETIIVEGERLPPTVSRKEMRGSELLRIPGTANDALKGLTTLPSIGIPNDYFGILYIRGSGPGDTLYYFDRTPLGYPFHYSGLVSTISSNIIDNIHIYAGGYGAEFGLDSQTVLDIHSRNHINEQSLNGNFNLNVLYSEGLLEGKITDKGYFHAAGRRSYLDLIGGLFFEDWVLPYFSDYQLKFAYELGEKHHLTLNAFGANDHFNIVEYADGVIDFSAYFKNGFEAQGIHLHSEFTENLTSHLSFTHGFTFLNADFRGIVSQTFELNERGERVIISTEYADHNIKVNVPIYTLREDIVYKITPKFQLEPGFLFAFTPANSFEDRRFPVYEEVTDPEVRFQLSEDEAFLRYDDGTYEVRRFEKIHDEFTHIFRRSEGYLQGRYDPLAFLSLALGVRFDYLNLTDELSIQPRGSLSVKLSNSSSLRFAYGVYEQSPLAYQVLAEGGNRDLKSSLAQHYIMEFEHELSSQTELKLATYYKSLNDLVAADDAELLHNDLLATVDYLNQGSGFIGGAEVFLRHRVSEKFFGWLSYAWTHREQRAHPEEPYEPYIFDNTHIISLVGNYSISPTLEVGGKWQYSSGTSSAHISEILLIQDPTTRGMQPLINNIQTEEGTSSFVSLPSYHRLDLRVSKIWNRDGWRIGAFLEILNVYNRKNVIKFYNPAGDNIEDAPQFPIIPYIGMTLEF